MWPERFIQTLEHEYLAHFAILEHKHLNYLVKIFVEYDHTQRLHQAKGNEPLLELTHLSPPGVLGKVLCEERLGGLRKHYYRQDA